MSKKHDDPRGKQKGPQQHAEGQHGERTHERFLEEIHESSPSARADATDPHDASEHPQDGGHRLFEERAQRDPADRASEKNRLDKDISEHGHNRSNFQVRGGTKSHPALPPEHSDPGNPDAE